MFLYRGTRMQSRTRYYVILMLMWIYALAWLAALAACYAWWNQLSLSHKVVLGVAVCIGAPAPPSLLFHSYSKYRAEWEQDNVG